MDTGKKKPKGPEIGLHQAKRLCQLDERKRLEFIAEGLPIILRSAESFWQASEQLKSHGREATVLEGYAKEEAAKVLILMDAVRCPPKLIASKLHRIVGWFYDHLARLIYAEAASWRPTNFTQLREYVDRHRRGHYVDGYAGEYIMPNSTVYDRESRLYVDVEAYQDGTLNWSAPRNPHAGGRSLGPFMPTALQVASAMEQVGMFTPKALKTVSEIWGCLEYSDKEDHYDGAKLTEQTIARPHAEGLLPATANEKHASILFDSWQIPMYNLDFSLIPVTREELEAEQEREYWSMVGDPR
jgi:hypothetical protein